jgi:hypothetical protein
MNPNLGQKSPKQHQLVHNASLIGLRVKVLMPFHTHPFAKNPESHAAAGLQPSGFGMANF